MKSSALLVFVALLSCASKEPTDPDPTPLPTQSELVNDQVQGPLCQAMQNCGLSCAGWFPVALPTSPVLCDGADVDRCVDDVEIFACADWALYSSPLASLPPICFGCLDLPTKDTLANEYLQPRFCAAAARCGHSCGGVFPVAQVPGELVNCEADQLIACIDDTWALTCEGLEPFPQFPPSCDACL
jgi:hypothetical protein